MRTLPKSGVVPGPTPGRGDEARRVIVIDDDDVMLLSCSRILQKSGYEVETCARGADGIARLAEVHPQILIVDLKMPELDGFQVIERVRAIDDEVVITVITGYATIGTAIEAMKAGAYDFLPKPFTPDELRLIVGRSYERWRLRREAAQLRHEKEEAERRFVTFVSHQLKTPIVAVKQYLDVLLASAAGELPETARAWIGRSQVRLGEMLELIQDWLTLARVERGHLCEEGERVDLAAALDPVVQAVRPQAEAAGVTLVADLAPPAGLPPVRGNALALSTVFANLLTNAVKYNRRGGSVTITARAAAPAALAAPATQAAPAFGSVEVQVRDTGIGIATEHLPRLFEEFYRAPVPEVRDQTGTGLGLAMCRRILGDLGGSIEAESTAGKGSTFTVRLPVAAEAAKGSA